MERKNALRGQGDTPAKGVLIEIMEQLSTFLANFDVTVLLVYLLRAAIALLCIVSHELAHGYIALRLGDDTAQRQGRLTLNPLSHIDPLGLLLMIFAGFGWAKPVPVNMRNFRNPKQGMAITALAGPACNLLIALAALGLASLIYHFLWVTEASVYIMLLLMYIAVMSTGLGMFNLIPIPPLDGSKILFSLLPDRIYAQILRYERYVMLVLFALVFFGVLDTPLSAMISWAMKGLCTLTGFPFSMMSYLGVS
ncbi:MAG: site-2 protease family protein [Clostridiales bacterium]|nr:site-2 protease family protein [Clostridiales bacterium]